MKAVLALGNPLQGDDNIGNLVLKKLKDSEQIKILEGKPEDLIGPLQKVSPDAIVFVDAVMFDGTPGEVRSFSIDELDDRFPSTHSMPANFLQKFFPHAKLWVIGIRPKEIGFSTDTSHELNSKFEEIVRAVKHEIDSI